MEVYADREYVSNGRLKQVGPAFRVGCGDSTKGRHHAVAVFECECGNRLCVRQATVRGGSTLSCGCYSIEKARELALTTSFKQLDRTTHGLAYSNTHRSWASMKARCHNPSHIEYERYGGRGIRVCERWMNSFEAFLDDMGERPDGCSIDRIDVSGNYEPANCRWADAKAQARNTRRNVNLTIDGITRCVAEWAEHPDASIAGTIYSRVEKGWTHRECVFGRFA